MGYQDRVPSPRFRWEQRPGGEIVEFVLTPDGTTERTITLHPDDEQRHYWSWIVHLTANLVGCPYCGASPCRPCRTFTGRIPGRISEPHHDRLKVADDFLRDRKQPPKNAPAVKAEPPEGPSGPDRLALAEPAEPKPA
jgi:hypothetical protein